MAHLRKIDHITYAVKTGTIEKWAWFHINVEGATLIERIDDVRPGDPSSSMKLWCLSYGEFGVALVEGIDRNERSQVTCFVEKHGDHSVQHVAYDCYDIDKFLSHVKSLGASTRGDVLVRNDGFGVLKQIFARGFAPGHPGEATFSEYCQRPRRDADGKDVEITFSIEAGAGFYEQVQESIRNDDKEPFFNLDLVPNDWVVPRESPAAQRGR